VKLKSRGLVIFLGINLVIALAIAFGGRVIDAVGDRFNDPAIETPATTDSSLQCR